MATRQQKLDTQMDQLTSMVKELVTKVESLQGETVQLREETQQLRDELAENTEITKHLRDVGTFVRVGTRVLKWVGVIAIAIGSVVAGWKMAVSGHAPGVQIGPHP